MFHTFHDYTVLQQEQLLSQPFFETSSIRLAFYCPNGKHFLRRSINRQIHDNFYLSDAPASLPSDSQGIVISVSDVDLMSSSLMCFAEALQSGADFVFSDLLYGADGDIFCTPVSQVCGFAAISADLYQKVRTLTDSDDPRILIQLAAQNAVNQQYLNQALVHFRKEPVVEDLFAPGCKHALLLSHEFTMTGAPIVLKELIPILQSYGYDVTVLGPETGAAHTLFSASNAAVLLHKKQLEHPGLYAFALNCDLILANTIIEGPSVCLLNNAPIPVIWWLHDAFQVYLTSNTSIVPSITAKNIFCCSAGPHAKAAFHSVRPEIPVKQLWYGLPDYAKETFAPYDLSFCCNKTLFINIGSIYSLKGQDILCRAIERLSSEEREKSAFLFVGRIHNPDLAAQIFALADRYPDNVFYRPFLTRNEVKSIMTQAACIICSSRDDCGPAVVSEGFIFGKPTIISEHTGIAGLITEGKEGFIYHNDDPTELAAAISHFLAHPEFKSQMQAACRELYEKYFSLEALHKAVGEILRQLP